MKDLKLFAVDAGDCCCEPVPRSAILGRCVDCGVYREGLIGAAAVSARVRESSSCIDDPCNPGPRHRRSV